MRIALFVTCVNDVLFPQAGIAVTTVLERLGHTVEFPAAQTCCGQPQANTGYADLARPVARHFLDVFDGYEAVVAPSGSCVAMIREQYPSLVPGSRPLTRRVYELSELLIDVLGVTDVGASFPARVTYHPTCHGLRALRLGDRPLRLLRAVRGLELVGLPDDDQCCGFGGTFAMKNADVSGAMLADKCDNVAATGAEFLAAADNSCLTHIGGGLARRPGAARTIHYAEILAATGRPGHERAGQGSTGGGAR